MANSWRVETFAPCRKVCAFFLGEPYANSGLFDCSTVAFCEMKINCGVEDVLVVYSVMRVVW